MLFAKNILTSPLYQDSIFDVFGISNSSTFGVYDWMSICVPSLLQPSKYLTELLFPFSSMFDNRVVIGIHISSGIVGNVTVQRGQNIMNATRVRATFPRISRLLKKNKDSLLFVTSDSPSYISLVKEQFKRRAFSTGIIESRYEGFDPFELRTVHEIMDLQLLSLCDYLFVSPGSGFSKLAISMNTHYAERRNGVYYF